MPDTYTLLVPPVPGACIASPGELEALVSQATPGTNIGMVYWGPTAPDIVTYPLFATFLWIDTSGPTIVVRNYNTATLSWEGPVIADGSIVDSMIADGTITLDKLSISGATAGYVLRVNSLGTAIIFDDTQNLFSSANRLNVNVLSIPAAGAWILGSNGTTNAWTATSALFTAGIVPISAIATTGAADPSVLSYVGGSLGYRTVNASTGAGTLAVNKLVVGPANYILHMKADGSEPEWTTPVSALQTADSGAQNMPTVVNTPVTYVHNLGSTALQITITATCVNANNGYSVGDIIPISAFVCDDNGGGISVSGAPALVWKVTNTQISMYLMADAGTFFKVRDVSTGTNAAGATTATDWTWRAIITKTV